MNDADFMPLYVIETTGPDFDVDCVSDTHDPDYQVNITLDSNGGDPLYSFANAHGDCHAKKGGKDHFASTKGTYTIKFFIYNDDDWQFDNVLGPFKVGDKRTAKYYAVSNLKHKTFTLHVTRNGDQPELATHSFNLYLIEDTATGKKKRRIDPDVDNPPIGLDPL